MPSGTLVVVNPRSRNGATGRRWTTVEARLRGRFPDLETEHTRAPRDAERIAREAVRAGIARILVAGGDGTTSEVVSGILGAGLGGEVEIGLLPLGTGGDLTRALGIPSDLDQAIERLAGGNARRVDAGRIDYRRPGGEPATSWFLNVASLGISGVVDRLVTQAPKAVGGAASFLIGTLRALARYRNTRVAVRVDGELVWDGPTVLAAAANGSCFGGGMQIAPDARIDDGLLDMVLITDLSKPRLLANLPSLYRGTHLSHPFTIHRRGKRLDAEALGDPVWLDVDGEPLGTLPASIEVVPESVTLLGLGV